MTEDEKMEATKRRRRALVEHDPAYRQKLLDMEDPSYLAAPSSSDSLTPPSVSPQRSPSPLHRGWSDQVPLCPPVSLPPPSPSLFLSLPPSSLNHPHPLSHSMRCTRAEVKELLLLWRMQTYTHTCQSGNGRGIRVGRASCCRPAGRPSRGIRGARVKEGKGRGGGGTEERGGEERGSRAEMAAKADGT